MEPVPAHGQREKVSLQNQNRPADFYVTVCLSDPTMGFGVTLRVRFL